MHDPHKYRLGMSTVFDTRHRDRSWIGNEGVYSHFFSIKFVCWTLLSIFHLYQFVFFSDVFCILMHLRLRFLFLIYEYLCHLDKLAIC